MGEPCVKKRQGIQESYRVENSGEGHRLLFQT
jgi:hypothetical protein